MGLGRWLAGRIVDWTTGRPDALADTLVDDVDRDLDDMRLITRHDAGPSVLLPERLRLAGRDAATLEDDLCRALAANCRACTCWRQCARDMAAGRVEAASYCANAHVSRDSGGSPVEGAKQPVSNVRSRRLRSLVCPTPHGKK